MSVSCMFAHQQKLDKYKTEKFEYLDRHSSVQLKINAPIFRFLCYLFAELLIFKV